MQAVQPVAGEIDDDLLIDLFHAAGRVIHGVTSDPACPHPESRTTLVVAVLGAGRLDWASIGDSAIFLGGPTRVARLDRPRNRFLGGPTSRRDVARTVDRGHLPLAPDDVVVLASDGVVDFAVIPDLHHTLRDIGDADMMLPEAEALTHPFSQAFADAFTRFLAS